MRSCPDCGRDISDGVSMCPYCGKWLGSRTSSISTDSSTPVSRPNNPTTKDKDQYHISGNIVCNSAAKTIVVVIGVILQIFALIVFFSFNLEDIKFGADFYTSSYQGIRYIGIALRWGISGILVGLGAILEFLGANSFYLRGESKKDA